MTAAKHWAADHAPDPLPRPSNDARQYAGAGRVVAMGRLRALPPPQVVLNVDGYGDAVPVPAFGPRMVCASCGIIGAFARPNWQERPTQGSLTGQQWRE